MDKLMRKKSTKNKKIRPKKTIWVVLLICLGLLALVFIGTSSYFEIDEFFFHGNHRIAKGELKSTLEKQNLNYWLFDQQKFKNNLLSNRWIKQVTKIDKEFPNKLYVEIEEREGQALIRDEEQEKYYTVSSDLVVMERYQENPGQLPMITGLNEGQFEKVSEGEQLTEDFSEPMVEVFELLKKYELTSISEIRLTEFRYSQSSGGMMLYLTDGSQVKIGELRKLNDKFRVLSKVKSELKQKSDDYYLDLRVPEYPVLVDKEQDQN
ncbi:cell division protein FtsQ/DivIB [Natranaerobius thermophilus]|uniref:Polypeptide-transport-associated domain protein FtsQ-type n=1 Tax=Natranaerobius thermophilus (strain ATCC BAA-1301 / DSM 18059 / JW/NM-WN-LF) TaxID=457570 RepID=B2A2H4_NATTJ|nr:FtsQ-type POTRA domain-containing protein [Natranaerobius thermophilus]ACB84889.1 Polypeptide-transport-associated domain protein FtsQ-type [Natranaerobius thermophilus JW/NM-WN-LF]